jgi:hypothetical protein
MVLPYFLYLHCRMCCFFLFVFYPSSTYFYYFRHIPFFSEIVRAHEGRRNFGVEGEQMTTALAFSHLLNFFLVRSSKTYLY